MKLERHFRRAVTCVLPAVLVLLLQVASAAKRSKDVYCGACVALLDEIEIKINDVNPKEKLQVGSFRVDPKGNQKLKTVPLARSELKLYEFMEDVCDKMSVYAETNDEVDGKKTFIRTSSRDGVRVSVKNVNFGGELAKSLKYACEDIREDHEETLIEMFQNSESDMDKKVCIEMTGYCTKEDIDRMKAAYSKAVQDGIVEEQQRNLEEANAKTEGDEDDSKDGEEDEDAEDEGAEEEEGNEEDVTDSSDSQEKVEL